MFVLEGEWKLDLGKLLQELMPKQDVKDEQMFIRLLEGERRSIRKKSVCDGSEAPDPEDCVLGITSVFCYCQNRKWWRGWGDGGAGGQ